MNLSDTEREILALGTQMSSLRDHAGFAALKSEMQEWVDAAQSDLFNHFENNAYPHQQDILSLAMRWQQRYKLVAAVSAFVNGAVEEAERLKKELNEHNTDAD